MPGKEFLGECGCASVQVSLSTAPDPTGATHWGQQTFCLHPPIDCAPGDAVEGSIRVTRKKENHRLMQVCMRLSHAWCEGPAPALLQTCSPSTRQVLWRDIECVTMPQFLFACCR